MAAREAGPSVPSPYDPGVGGSPAARLTGGALSGSSATVIDGKPPWASPPDALSLLRALGKHWVKALLLGLFLGLLSAGLTWLLFPKTKYHAKAAIQVEHKTPTNLPGSTPIGGDEPVGAYIQTEVERFRMDTVLARAVGLLRLNEFGVSQDGGGAEAGGNSGGDPSDLDTGDSAAEGDSVAATPGDASPDAAGAAARGQIGKYAPIFGGVDPREWLKEHLEISSRGNIIWVTLRSEVRVGLDEVVNAVAEAYVADNHADLDNLQLIRVKLEDKGKEYERQLLTYRNTLQQLTEQGQDPNDPRTFALTRQLGLARLADLQHDYSKLKGDLKRAEAQLAGLKARQHPTVNIEVSQDDVERYFKSLDAVRELEHEIAELDEQIAQVRYASRDKTNDAAILKFQQQRRTAVASLEKLGQEWRPQIEKRLREQAMTGGDDGQTFANQVAALELEVKLLNEFKTEMELELKSLVQQNKEFSNSAADMFKAQNEFKYADRAMERIRARLAELAVEEGAPPRVRIADPAVPPSDREDRQKKFASTLMAGGGMFVMSLLMVAFLEFRTRRVKAPDEVVRGLGMGVVGTIPSLPDNRTRRPGNAAQLGDSRWQQAFMESVDATRMLLLHMSRSENLRVVMITSASSGEGKTSLACYLGGSLARAVHRTLIVDCDLRRPAVNQVFDTPLEPGLCDLLRGEAEIQDIVRPTPIDGLFVIPAGRFDGQALLSLSKGELGPILDWLKEQYDFVIVDSPPVLAVADTLQLSQHVDAVLFSILRDVSRMPEVYEARQRLATMNVRVLGAVMSGTPLAGIGYDRRYAYGEKATT